MHKPSERPATSQALDFSGEGEPAVINYSVPLPGSHTGRRILELDLALEDQDWLDTAAEAGTDLSDEIGLTKTPDGKYVVDVEKALSFWETKATAAGVRHHDIAFVRQEVAAELSPAKTIGGLTSRGSPQAISPEEPDTASQGPGDPHSKLPAEMARATISEITVPTAAQTQATQAFSSFVEGLSRGEIQIPGHTWGGGLVLNSIDVDAEAEPALFLVEYYGISSFLGDYGLGRTVKTFTLLPGESTTISMRTWRATAETIAEGSSIIDSHHEEASERFASSVQSETTDKSTQASTEQWHAEAEASASWGWGSAGVSGGGGGEYHSSREEFAKQIDETTQEHASEASASREISVTSSSESSEETEEETVIERTIKNVNMRRVLNFVFRELNQEYTTKTHLKQVKVAFTNGLLNTWREVPLSGMRTLLQEVLVPDKVDEVAQAILKTIGVTFDHQDQPVAVLEQVEMAADGQSWRMRDAELDGSGEYPAPTESRFYRFKRGPLAQDGSDNPVDGVLMRERTIVMRTDSVIVEALLGEADALDNYAMEVQEAAARAKTLTNQREALALKTLSEISDPRERAEAFATMFNPPSSESED